MSLQYNDRTNRRGILQLLEKELGFKYGDISEHSERKLDFTADINLAWDEYIRIAIKSSGTWQYDDSNYDNTNGGYPIIKADLVSGQRDYPFVTDGFGNLILDIHKVLILPSSTATTYTQLDYFNELADGEVDNDVVTESAATGTPSRYGRLANGIFLETPTNYSVENGLKVFISREANYFTVSDITKKPGCPGNHHAYFYLRPALEYARRNGLDNVVKLEERVLRLEKTIEEDFSRRSRDERNIMTGKKILYI